MNDLPEDEQPEFYHPHQMEENLANEEQFEDDWHEMEQEDHGEHFNEDYEDYEEEEVGMIEFEDHDEEEKLRNYKLISEFCKAEEEKMKECLNAIFDKAWLTEHIETCTGHEYSRVENNIGRKLVNLNKRIRTIKNNEQSSK